MKKYSLPLFIFGIIVLSVCLHSIIYFVGYIDIAKNKSCSLESVELVVMQDEPMSSKHLYRNKVCASYGTSTNLSGSDMKYADFRAAVARCVDFSRANLEYADFSGADLRYASFYGANLTECKFDNANIEGAVFDKAVMRDYQR